MNANDSSEYEKIVHNMLNNPTLALFLIIYIFIIGIKPLDESLQILWRWFQNFYIWVQRKTTADTKLIQDARELAKSIVNFSNKEQHQDPVMHFEQFHESIRQSSSHMLDVMTEYAREFQPKIAYFRQEFIKRGLLDRELDQLYEHPTNYIGLGMVASRINELAAKLESKLNS